MKLRRALFSGVVLALALALAACTGLPTTGGVNLGLPAGEDPGPPPISYVPDRPQPGATQQEIVEGFIKAGSGPAENWGIAQLYLAPSARGTWNPEAGVIVDLPADRQFTSTSDTTMTVKVTPTATVDSNGSYALDDGGPTPLGFTLERSDGEWRITKAPDGVVLDETIFSNVYHAYSVMYFDPTWNYLVPDLRWFPTTNPATYIASALIDKKPSDWIAASVVSAFPQNVNLASRAVPTVSGVAQVDLAGAVLAVEPTVLGRMQAQLQASLATAGITGVRMSYSGATLQTTAASTQLTSVNPVALVLNAAGFGFLSGSELTPVSGISDAISTLTSAPTSIELSSDQSFAAVKLASGRVGRVQADRKWLEFDPRANLIAPTVDPQGFIWSVPSDAPTGLTAFSAAGDPSAVSGWSSASKITAMQLSRDGTRMAAIATVGGRSVIWLAGVVRNADGLPKSLGQPVVLAALPGAGIDVAWLDDKTLGVLANTGDGQVMIEQQVGGPGKSMPTPAGETMTDIAGANQPTGVRLRDATGTLYVRRGANWGSAASQITVLGTQQ